MTLRLRHAICALLLFATTGIADNPPATINVDASANVHAINPMIYGLNSADTATLNALNCTSNRYGGNRTSRYNWQQNVDQTGEFYYWESYPDANVPFGLADNIVNASQGANAAPLITIPMIDWIAKTDAQRHILCSYPQTLYPNETDYSPECANPNVQPICCGTGFNNITNDWEPWSADQQTNASTPNSLAMQTTFVQHLAGEGSHYYILDNEHGIWHETHREVQPNGVDMDTIWGKMRDYSAMIKTQDPNAVVLGPEEYGWTGYFYSGSDIQNCNINGCWANPPDWLNHCGGVNEPPCDPIDYMGWVLDQFMAYDTANATRLLDVFTLHFYPQGDLNNHYEYSDDVSTAAQNLRNRSTRGLWDSNYVNESWIGQAGPDNGIVQLIPRMKNWISQHYHPDTLTGITEYHWGPLGAAVESHMNGATTQADVLGIFGREGLDFANLYTDGPINSGSAIANAFKMYRNYDGSKSTFGDMSVSATGPNPDNISTFAATRTTDGALTIIVISKYLSQNTPITINLANFSHNGTAQVWRLSNNTLSHLADKTIAGNAITDSIPLQSVTLYVVPTSVVNPDFTLSCSPTSLFAPPGGSDGSNCSVGSVGGFANDVTLSCAGLPAGATCAFVPNPVAPGNSSALTVNVDNAVAEGNYNFTVDGTDGVLSHSQNMTLIVSTGPAALLFDDFEDDNFTWVVQKGNWTETGGALNTPSFGSGIVAAPTPWFPSGLSSCSVCTLETDVTIIGGKKLTLQPWYLDKSHRVDVIIKQSSSKIVLKQVFGGTTVAKSKAVVPLTAGTSYQITVGYDGANFTLAVDGVNQLTFPAGAVPSGNLLLKTKDVTASIEQITIF